MYPFPTTALPRQQRREGEHRVRHMIGGQLGDPPEDDGEDDHRQKRPDEGPENADGGLLVPDGDVAPRQKPQQLTRLPDLGEVELRESAAGFDDGVQGIGSLSRGERRGSVAPICD